MNAETLDVIEYLQKLLDAAIAGQETLQKALIESQRREKAAIEHLCRECRKICDKIYDGKTPCATCWWRAPEEGENYE